MVEGRDSNELQRFSLGVQYDTEQGQTSNVVTVPTFHFSRQPTRNTSAPVSFFVPIDNQQGLRLSVLPDHSYSDDEGVLDVLLGLSRGGQDAEAADTGGQVIHLAADASAGTAKLRRGVYLIGVPSRSGPDWSRATAGGSYVMMSVEYGHRLADV